MTSRGIPSNLNPLAESPELPPPFSAVVVTHICLLYTLRKTIKARSFFMSCNKGICFKSNCGIWTWRLVKLKWTSSNLQTFGTSEHEMWSELSPYWEEFATSPEVLYGNNSISLIQAGLWGVFFQLFHLSVIQNQLYIFWVCMIVWFAVKLGVDVMSLVDKSQRKEVAWDSGITLSPWTLSFVTLKNSYLCNTRALLWEAYKNII